MRIRFLGGGGIGFEEEQCVEGSSEVESFAVVTNDVALSVSGAVIVISGGPARIGFASRTISNGTHTTR